MEFRKSKINYVFDSWFDVDKDGSIKREDFEIAVQKICSAKKYGAGTPKYDQTNAGLLGVWESLRKQADADGDGEVSRDEWTKLWLSDDATTGWRKLYMDFMFQLFDEDGDGSIDQPEFEIVTGAFNVSQADSAEAFKKISNNGSLTLDKSAYQKLWSEYFTSTDSNATGNWIFGKGTF